MVDNSFLNPHPLLRTTLEYILILLQGKQGRCWSLTTREVKRLTRPHTHQVTSKTQTMDGFHTQDTSRHLNMSRCRTRKCMRWLWEESKKESRRSEPSRIKKDEILGKTKASCKNRLKAQESLQWHPQLHRERLPYLIRSFKQFQSVRWPVTNR